MLLDNTAGDAGEAGDFDDSSPRPPPSRFLGYEPESTGVGFMPDVSPRR